MIQIYITPLLQKMLLTEQIFLFKRENLKMIFAQMQATLKDVKLSLSEIKCCVVENQLNMTTAKPTPLVKQ